MTKSKPRRTAPKIKRVYEDPESADGFRVLVDRVWPRGLSKQKAAVDLWLKDIAPSGALRKWFGHEPERWETFRKRYFEELDANPDAVAELRKAIRGKKATLIYAAREQRFNNAVALKEYLSGTRARIRKSQGG